MTASYRDQRFSRHFHEGYALGVIEAGALAFRYRGEGLVAAAGDINLTVPGEVHDGHAAGEAGWSYRMFYLPGAALRAAAPDGARAGSGPYFPRAVLGDKALAKAVGLVHRVCANPNASLLEKETRLLGLLSAWIARHASGRPAASPDQARPGRASLTLIEDYLRDNCGQDVRLDDLARLTGLSPFHLVRSFARQTGLTPHAYLVAARLDKAKALLATPMRLAEVAAHAGFADQAHLTRLFKRRFGITPKALRLSR